MKPPITPPAMFDLWRDLAGDPQRFLTISTAVASPLVSGKYLHWDKLRFRQPPEGLTHREWWLGLKLRRNGQPISLVDPQGEPFSFLLIDPMIQALHEIDRGSGMAVMSDQMAKFDVRNSYLVRSLIEEAFTSSQLEGASSTRKIAKELVLRGRPPRTQGERMILNNYRTMQRIVEIRNEPLSRALVFEIHGMITEGALDDPSGVGRLRRPDERIIVGDEEGNIYHTPPDATQLEARMEAMCAFANVIGDQPFIHPVLRSMILHFWLAYDHPFIDGNGRTARALFYWSMLRNGYWLFEFVSVSQAILKAPMRYLEAYLHTETDGNDLTYFLIYHVGIIRKAIEDFNALIGTRSQEIKELESDLRGMETLNYRQKELIRHALRHPGHHYKVESHRASHNVSRQTANRDLLELESKGLLRRVRVGKSNHFIAEPDLKRKLVQPSRSR